MRKKIVAILLTAAMAMGIAACGNQSESNKEAKKDDNTITVWCWDKTYNIFAMEEAAKIYQEDHQDVKIDIVEVGDVDVQSRLTTAATSGDLSTLPDVFLMQDHAFQKNVLSYPDAFIEISEEKIDFSEIASGKTDFSVVDGKHYGVPFDNGAAIACYRTDILQEAGMTLEDFTDITWDEWVEKGKVVLEKTGKPLLTTTAGECDLLTMMLQSAGASLFNEDGTTNIAKNDTLKKVIDTYCKMKDSGVLQEVNNWDEYTGSMLNSKVAGVISMVICSLAGYGFEIYHDKAKDAVMGVILLAMMVPFITILVPLFQMVAKMKMLNSTLGFILPTVSTPFLIMMFRQSARSFPHDIIEAARLEGLSEIRIFFQMFIPTMKSTYAAAMTITFMNAWNSYMWPKVIMTQSKSMTMPMVVANLTEGYVTDYGMLMLAVLICTLPTALVFFILQKNFAEGITGAVK